MSGIMVIYSHLYPYFQHAENNNKKQDLIGFNRQSQKQENGIFIQRPHFLKRTIFFSIFSPVYLKQQCKLQTCRKLDLWALQPKAAPPHFAVTIILCQASMAVHSYLLYGQLQRPSQQNWYCPIFRKLLISISTSLVISNEHLQQ